jgi:hypothetical protein
VIRTPDPVRIGRTPGRLSERWPADSSAVVEVVAKLPREGFGLARISGLAAEETAVVAREHGRLLTEQLSGCHRRAPGEGVAGLLANGDHDASRRRGQRVDIGSMCDRRGVANSSARQVSGNAK